MGGGEEIGEGGTGEAQGTNLGEKEKQEIQGKGGGEEVSGRVSREGRERQTGHSLTHLCGSSFRESNFLTLKKSYIFYLKFMMFLRTTMYTIKTL